MAAPQPLRLALKRPVLVLSALAAVLVAVTAIALRPPAAAISNFEQCREAGGALLETYPEQCMIKGVSYTKDMRPVDADTYIGLKEGEALTRAKQSNTPARTVERDGTPLPQTMDFVPGRHNLYVKDGKVYKVDIEGQAVDNQK